MARMDRVERWSLRGAGNFISAGDSPDFACCLSWIWFSLCPATRIQAMGLDRRCDGIRLFRRAYPVGRAKPTDAQRYAIPCAEEFESSRRASSLRFYGLGENLALPCA